MLPVGVGAPGVLGVTLTCTVKGWPSGDGSGDIGVIHVEHVEALAGGLAGFGFAGVLGLGGDPFGTGDAVVAFGPHPAHFGGEADDEIEGVVGVDLE